VRERQGIVTNLEYVSTKKKKGTGQYIVQDKWFFEAKKLGYRARSAFKLLEIQDSYQIIKPGMKVLDIASAPGSFLQVISKVVGPDGLVLWVDLQQIKPFGQQNIRVLQGDIFDQEKIEKFCEANGVELFDVITSDIAPNTTGLTGVDQYRSIELNIAILEFADRWLMKWGNLLLKVFVGEDIQELITPIKQRYVNLRRIKPKACRDRSFEEYFLCVGKKD
jgi:23S rRNA (uridine2552-2'-O)-methyltransferase